MRILFLSKRQYTGKDLLDDRYGRLYELPLELALLGHQVSGLCMSYRSRREGHFIGPGIDKTPVDWYSVNFGRLIISGVFRYVRTLKYLIRRIRPEVIIVCSDAVHSLVGSWIARKYHIPYIVDLYDNFESFGLTRFPGMLSRFKRSINFADGITCVSAPLQKYIIQNYEPKGLIETIINGIPSDLFYNRDQDECRRLLNLPLEAKLVGTAGALDGNRGIETLLAAYSELADREPSLHLVLAGPVEPKLNLPRNPRIHYLGELPYDRVSLLFNSLDVGIICYLDSAFGRYCFPQKAYEMIACGLPVVAADVGVMTELFSGKQDCLYKPGNHQSLMNTLKEQLDKPTRQKIEVILWSELAKKYENFIYQALGR